MRISVVMATYNGGLYVEEQMESIYNQTLKPDEVLIFDDKSTDMVTPKTISDFIKKKNDSRWKFIINPQNLGWKSNFIQAIKHANGNYIFLADQDDIWDTRKIERMAKIMDEDQEIGLLCSNYKLLNETKRKIIVNSRNNDVNDGSLCKIAFDKKFHYVGRPGCTFCIRKSFAEKITPLWVEDFAHDQLFWIAGLYSEELYCLNEPLIQFRRHENNATMKGPQIDNIKRANSQEIEMTAVKRIIQKMGEKKREKYKDLLQRYFSWADNRVQMLKKGSILLWMKNAIYIDLYTSPRSYAGDLLSIIKSKGNKHQVLG